ncbi:D-hexose-6-phosphate mutarotase [Mannheimia sp. AT1]|uniref:glucose-6-phosphate 1-epimerase n=1 Tax=Mannheimia cairinae TaxID=3025936 RepID=A0ABT5MPN3_9PAST|nr:D-hexose-6-phosphate mutarotase [Mannheimia cairinae]MDD0823449.1 D-hexose-6-phosphate mutarotase [Mannheimia cairinae]MDD0826943.1 D-hexose-6-phosphate mutarotase [Mannheimia cairinae]
MSDFSIKSISPELNIVKYNELAILEVNHPKAKAKIALQGAQLLSWQPYNATQDVLWLSDIEPFKIGTAIRGGVPICYPWFGNVKTPAHGTARISEWSLVEHSYSEDYIRLVFALENDAKIEMMLGESCTLNFTHLGADPAQLALHTYFNIGDINKLEVEGLPTSCFDKLTNQQVDVPSPRIIQENVDCIYAAQAVNFIQDFANQRTIKVEHINATETVLWNPWHKPTGGMSENAYQKMVCVETARLNTLLQQNDTMSVKISL